MGDSTEQRQLRCWGKVKPKKAKSDITMRSFWLAIFVCACLPAVLFYAGCAPQIIAVLGTPTSAETEGAAEYDISKNKDQKILVFVDQPSYLSAYANLRFFITDMIGKMLQTKAKIKPSQIIDYKLLADLRANTADFYTLSPIEAARKLDADLVLVVTIIDCKIRDISEAGYVSGTLDAQAALYSVSSGEKLWPTTEQSRLVGVGFESERRGRGGGVVRLAAAAAHCVTRYLYNCPKAGFKISDERTASGW
jgi:hypothetical protein